MNPLSGSFATDASLASAAPSLATDLEHLVPGARWREVYQIGEQFADVTFGKVFKGLHVGLMNDVVIRSFRVGDNVRARTWDEIRKIKNGGLLELLDGVESEGRRIEVMQAAPSLTLREWASRRKATQAEIELIVRQLSQALASLHKQGVVHLNLRADNVFVRATEGGLNVLLGGFETATLLVAEGLVEVSMDPFYAPPETLGLFHYPREPGLRAWDWWSLGRVMQEVVVGRHILGYILDRDVTRATPDLRARAENLLKELDPNMRAGAVEAMPAMDRELTTLLRGLLTGSRDGRWGLEEVERWLRKESVKERYSLPKNERLFIWKERAYTVSEAGEHFVLAEHWQDGMTNLFDKSNSSTLAHFIGTESAHRKTRERFDILMQLGEAPAFQQLPPEITNDVVMAVVLKFLTGHHAPLILRGRRIDADCLKSLLSPEAQPVGLGTVYGFIAEPIVQQVVQFDAEVGRMLGELGRVYEAAATLAQQNNWLSTSDVIQLATLMSLSLEPEIPLAKIRAEMLKRYACSRDPALDKLFKKRDAGLIELVVIAFTEREPERFGYVTHQAWNAERYQVLSEQGTKLAEAGLWLNLGYAIKLGPLVFGRLRLILPVWFVLSAAMAFVGQNLLAYVIAGVCPVVAMVVRFIWFGFHRVKLQHRLHEAKPWTLRSGWSRCREEALAILKTETVPGLGGLLRLLNETNEEIGRLTLEPAPKPVKPPHHFRDTQMVAIVSWVLVLMLSAGTIWYGVRHPPKIPTLNWERIVRLWSSSDEKPAAVKDENAKPKLSAEQTPTGSVKSLQTTLEELRRAKREADKQDEPLLKISWPFKEPNEAQPVRIQETLAAVPEQTAIAQEMGQLLVDRYEPSTIAALIAVQVPTEKGVGLMLFDGRTGKVSGKKVFILGFVPFSKSWVELDSKKVLYLGGL